MRRSTTNTLNLCYTAAQRSAHWVVLDGNGNVECFCGCRQQTEEFVRDLNAGIELPLQVSGDCCAGRSCGSQQRHACKKLSADWRMPEDDCT